MAADKIGSSDIPAHLYTFATKIPTAASMLQGSRNRLRLMEKPWDLTNSVKSKTVASGHKTESNDFQHVDKIAYEVFGQMCSQILLIRGQKYEVVK